MLKGKSVCVIKINVTSVCFILILFQTLNSSIQQVVSVQYCEYSSLTTLLLPAIVHNRRQVFSLLHTYTHTLSFSPSLTHTHTHTVVGAMIITRI